MFLTFKMSICSKLNCFEIELFICIKIALVLNNLQRLICHKTLTNKDALFYVIFNGEKSSILESDTPEKCLLHSVAPPPPKKKTHNSALPVFQT